MIDGFFSWLAVEVLATVIAPVVVPPVANSVADSLQDAGTNIAQYMPNDKKSCAEIKSEQAALAKRIKIDKNLPEDINKPLAGRINNTTMTEEDWAAKQVEKPATRLIELAIEFNKRCSA